MPEPFRGPWKGRNKILLSIDIGLAHSGVSFVYLENGANQTLHSVTKWPGRGALGMEGMFPTLVWYDENDKAVGFGGEGRLYQVEAQAEEKGWFVAKNFKAQLHPEDTGAQNPRISVLPFGVSLRQVYSDFLGYLLRHTKSYFENRFLDGAQVWESHKPTMEVVMSHPNGWGAREQAGFTTSDMAPSNIRFVTDTDASAYYCLLNASLTSRLQTGDVLLLCDAGDAATRVSLHRVESTSPIFKLRTCCSECLGVGASSVDAAAERYMRQLMDDAGISTADVNNFTTAGIEDFRKHAKLDFNDETEEYLVRISGVSCDNPALKTRRGHLVLPGSAVKLFFEDYINVVRQAINRHLTGMNVSYMLLVGHLGENSYLQRMIKELSEPRGCQTILASNSTSRAIVDGALIWDISINIGHKPLRSVYIETSGGGWWESIAKVAAIKPGTEIKEPMSLKYPKPRPEPNHFELEFLSYANEAEVKRIRDEKGVLLDGFSKWFTLSANLDVLSGAVKEKLGARNVVFSQLDFDVRVRFGEIHASQYILLVGGFGDSLYIRDEFKKRYEPRGSKVTLTNDSTSKAVADGAVIWSTLSSVYSRAPRYSFGTYSNILFNPFVHSRQGRVPYTCYSGDKLVTGVWSQIVQKGVALDAKAVCRESYRHLYTTATPDLELFTLDLLAYSGNDKPEWALDPDGKMLPGFQKSCTIRANLQNLQGALKSTTGSHGSRYWILHYDICIRFGGTELEGYMEWEERGVKRTGPISMISQDID
ncbi:hypothetical protein RSAG8_02886, partial [Rhizoctonia solani AG-8 WAC10335]